MEGEDEGVATAAIDSSKFFDMIVWKVVFTMMEKMGAGKEACASLTAAVAKTLWKDQRRRYKDILRLTQCRECANNR